MMSIAPEHRAFTVSPIGSVRATVTAPASKPESQRALLLASLAAGRSRVGNALRSHETDAMATACARLGAGLVYADGGWEIAGCGFAPGYRPPTWGGDHHVWAAGSGLVARIFATLGSAVDGRVVVDGNGVLRGRVMAPLFRALVGAGVDLAFLDGADRLPVANQSRAFPGGDFCLPGDVSSQFATALMLAAPFGERATRVRMSRPVHSIAYLAQTADALRRSGVALDHADDFAEIVVEPSALRPFETVCGGDFTSASYLVAAAAILPSRLTIEGLAPDSLQGERSIVAAVAEMGVSVTWEGEAVTIANPSGRLAGHYRVDIADGPNILPTLAAIGAFVEGSLTVTGGGLTRFHKSNRIAAMVGELRKLGVDIEPVERAGHPDGFVVRGRPAYAGGVDLLDHGDHRNFMSLFVASLRCARPNRILGQLDVAQSFPDFLRQFELAGYPTPGDDRTAAGLAAAAS